MKELKLSKDDGIDKDALLKFMETTTTEPYWKVAGKTVGEQCMTEVTTKKDEIIKAFEKAPFNIKKEQCNPIYAYMTACISFEAFKVRFLHFKHQDRLSWGFFRNAPKKHGRITRTARRLNLSWISAKTRLRFLVKCRRERKTFNKGCAHPQLVQSIIKIFNHKFERKQTNFFHESLGLHGDDHSSVCIDIKEKEISNESFSSSLKLLATNSHHTPEHDAGKVERFCCRFGFCCKWILPLEFKQLHSTFYCLGWGVSEVWRSAGWLFHDGKLFLLWLTWKLISFTNRTAVSRQIWHRTSWGKLSSQLMLKSLKDS